MGGSDRDADERLTHTLRQTKVLELVLAFEEAEALRVSQRLFVWCNVTLPDKCVSYGRSWSWKWQPSHLGKASQNAVQSDLEP